MTLPVVACSNCGRVTHHVEREGETCGIELRTPLGFNDEPPRCDGILVNPKPKTKRRRRGRKK